MKRKRSLADEIFPRRGFGIYDFDKIKLSTYYTSKEDIVRYAEEWKTLSDHEKKYYIDKGYYNMYLELHDNLFMFTDEEQDENMDLREAESKAHFAFTNLPTPDLDPYRTKYTKLGRQVASQMLKNSHLRFGLPNRDHLVGVIAMDYYGYDEDFPPENLGPNEVYVDTYPPLNNTTDYDGEWS